ncbi:MAG: VanZ family protein [Firmicutes bacterium]|nr:VanZ family protein [Bacillota bacterium]
MKRQQHRTPRQALAVFPPIDEQLLVVFAVFTFLLGLTLKIGGVSLGWIIIAALWSYVDEATKPWIQGRHFSWFDVGLNLIGTFIGGAVVLIL